MNEVEEANDAARLRLSRMRRAINKMRLERAFLLEQMSKRTSTNVEDSEGSPSPPPTVGSSISLLLRPFPHDCKCKQTSDTEIRSLKKSHCAQSVVIANLLS